MSTFLIQNRYINLIDALKKSADGNNGITFIDNNGSYFLLYKELYNKALGIAGYLREKVNPADNEIIILLDNNKDFVPVFWGCLTAKIKAVPVTIGNSEEHKLKLFKVWENLISPYIITTKTAFENLKSYAQQNGFEIIYEKIKERLILINEIDEKPDYTSEKINPEDIAFIQYSSGSTGFPKGVILTHKNLVITSSAYIKKSKIDFNDSFLSWFPLTHDMGLIGWHITPLLAGINQVLIETSLFVRRPALWMDKTTEHKSTILCSPNYGLKHFIGFTKMLDNADWDLSNVRIIANGAEPISPKLCDDFLNALKPYGLKYSAMTPGYGLAEIGLIATISDYKTNFETIHLDRLQLNIGQKILETEETSDNCLSFVCEGDFIPEMEVKITNDKGENVPEKYIGNIHLKGDSVTSGYYNNKIATEQLIKNGWLNTGDLGFLKNNKLYLTGRSKELIIINGYNYYPHDIERVCLSIEDLDLGKIVAAGLYEESLNQEVLLIFVYFKSNAEKFLELYNKIKEVILKSIGINVYKVIPVKKIPKTTSGKVQRFVLLENYKQGEFDDVIAKIETLQKVIDENTINPKVTKEYVINELKLLVNKVINIKEINENEILINYGIDSIRGIELLGKIKDLFKIEVDQFVYIPDLSLLEISEIILKNVGDQKSSNDELKNIDDSGTQIYEASAGQFAIYYHFKNHPTSAAYNISITCRVLNEIDINKLNEAYNYVINRHQILRSKCFMTDKLYYQVITSVSKSIEFIETEETNLDKLRIFIKNKVETPFDIEKDSVIRSFLCKTKIHGWIYIVNLHHIAGDARSLFILLQEILTCYDELVKYQSIKSLVPQSAGRYSDYVKKEIKYLNSTGVLPAKEYWTKNLLNVDFGINLSGNFKNGQVNSDSLMFKVQGRKSDELQNMSDFVFMFSVYCYLLHRYTHQKEIIVGIPVADNQIISDKKKNEDLVGYAINTLPIKSTLNGTETVLEYLEKTKQTIINAMKYQSYPLSKIAENINISRNNNDSLFKTMFTFLPVSSTNKLMGLTDYFNEENEIDFGRLKLKPFYLSQQEGLFDLAMEMVTNNNNIVGRISYNNAKYDKKYIKRFAEHYKNIVDKFVLSLQAKISTIDILSTEEKLQLDSFNNTKKIYNNYSPIIKLIEHQAEITPDNTAYIFDGNHYSYKWVNNKANGLAEKLLNAGIKKGGYIPLFMQKGIELPIAILAIMKTGNAFIPLDVNEPGKRLNIFINDINPEIIITTKEFFEKLSFLNCCKIILADENNIKETNKNPNVKISLDDPIYGIYTSGTTGVPKCAINQHKGITNRFKFMDDYFGINNQRVVYHSANYIFDTSVYQLFWPLTQGAKVIIPVSSVKLNLDYMLDLIERYKVTYIDLVPSVFNILVEYFENNSTARNKFNSIKHLSVGGEAIVPDFINKFKTYFPTVKITNIYGPTETAIGMTFYDVKLKSDEIPIGKPISNTQVFILDENKNRLPIGVTGEIYVGGECVGLGYLNDPAKTDTVFIDNIFTNSGKLYKTGDFGYYLPDGNIIFKGRADEQIKIRGVRIEPEEIRANIINVSFVNDAVVVTKETNNGETILVAYVVYKNGYDKTDELRNELLKSLPEIYIPQYFVAINEIPLNANGKINKFILPEINISNIDYNAGTYSGSVKLLDIWREVLGREIININDKFFDCGGNSLKALLLKIKIQQSYGIELGIEKILTNPTLMQLEEILTKLSPVKNNIIPIAKVQKYYPLSNQQKRMWLLCNGKNASKAYSMIGVIHITGKINLSALHKAWEKLVQRHESLRTKYKVIKGEPVQIITKKTELDYTDIVCENIKPELNKVVELEKNYSFDLSKTPLFKIITISDNKNNTNIVLHLFHIITDGWSTKIMFNELSNYYNSIVNGDKYKPDNLPIQYKDYSVWLKSEFSNTHIKEAEEYWNNKLSGDYTVTLMPADYDKSCLQKHSAEVVRFLINPNITEKANLFCKDNDITLFMLLISATAIVLNRYSNNKKIVLGTPVSGRNYPGLEEQIGLFVNTIVLKAEIKKDNKYSEFLKNIKNEILESFKYQDYPYDKLAETKNVNYGASLFEVFVSFEGIEDEIKLHLGESEYKFEEITNLKAKFNISLLFKEKTDGIELVIEYANELYKEERINLFAAHVEKVLAEIINNPETKINLINILSEEEKIKIFKYSSAFQEEDNKWISVVDQLKQTVKENENNKAVFHQGQSLTYRLLDINSDKIASVLINKGIKEESIVALLTTKSIDMITAMIGILKAGAAYLPLDPNNPIDRLKVIVKDSGCKLILTNIGELSNNHFECEVLNINDLYSLDDNKQIVLPKIKPSQLAYVIYTSGSTGKPKGVMIEHHSLNNLIKSLCYEVYDLCGNHLNIALQASQVFDASIQQIFPALVRGDTLHLIDDETKLNGKLTADYFEKYKINIADLTPTLFDLQLRGGFDKIKCRWLKHLLIGGEPLNNELLCRFYSSGNKKSVKILNVYGPTECCVDTTCFSVSQNTCEKTGITSIGKPMLNTKSYILDENLQLVPLGITGELYLEGENVGRGYINNEELTNAKFIQSPFIKNKKLYKTGDLCSISYDGNINYCGRIDNQIKIRGYRVELGEIENIIDLFIKQYKCIVVYDTINSELVAFIEKRDNVNLDLNLIVEQLRNKLPGYMCPAKFIEIEKLPLTHSGKPDRIELAASINDYIGILPNKNYVKPQTESELKLVKIWQEVLAVDEIGINDNFYELGGHSLKSLKIMSSIVKQFGCELRYKDILSNSTIKELALLIDSFGKGKYKPIPKAKKQKYYELSHAQKRIWLECEFGNSAAYNITGVFQLSGKLDVNLLQKSINKIIDRHESLRTRFAMQNGLPKQFIYESENPIIGFTSLLYSANIEETFQKEINTITGKSLNIFADNLVNFNLIQTNNQEYYLIASVHHILTDGWSIKLMLKELSEIYNAYKKGLEPELKKITIQYKDYSVWFEKELKSIRFKEAKEYWNKKISGKLSIVLIPNDEKEKNIKDNLGKIKRFVLNEEITKKIRGYAVTKEVTVFIFLLSVLEIVLHKNSNNDEIILGTPVSGRNHPDLEDQLGLYINTLVLRNKIESKNKYCEFLSQVKNEVLESYNYQDYPFDKLMEDTKRRNNGGLFNLFVSYETTEDEIKLNLQEINVKYLEIETGTNKFDISIIIRERQEVIELIIEYTSAVYNEKSITKLGTDIQSVIFSVINNEDQIIELLDINATDIKVNPKTMDKKVTKYNPPKSVMEKEIVLLWEEILKVKRVGIEDNFFELGGQSIKALQLVTMFKEKYNINPELKFVFSNQTIKEQAKEIENIIWINSNKTSDNIEDIII